jgi:methionyl-tRNA synthetase
MKPTNNNGEIFTCNNCGNHAQPTPQASGRKKVIFRDDRREEDYYLNLTNEQIDLLEWMISLECIVEGSYELIEDTEFITI